MTIWEILNISATKDKDMIRNAYRKQLKNVNPEDDPEGFMNLRSAYEQAVLEADSPDDETKTQDAVRWDEPDEMSEIEKMTPKQRIDHWLGKADSLYQSFYDRIREEPWRMLLEDDVCQRLDMADETRVSLLQYLLEHTKFPNRIWKLFDQTFSLIEDGDELKEKFPSEFIDYIKNAVTYEGVLDYDLFEGAPDAPYDQFIESYFFLKYDLDYEKFDDAKLKLGEMTDMGIWHPYLNVEMSRLMVLDNKADDACEMLKPLAKKYDEKDYLLYYYGCALEAADKDEEAKAVFEQVIKIEPDHYMAKFALADLLLKGGQYAEAKEAYLVLADINEHDEIVVEHLQKANKFLIPEFERKVRENPEDFDSILDLGWCMCQNEDYEKCYKMIEHLQVDEEHLYDYINLKGRVLLCLNRFKDALPFLIRWRDMILDIVDDGQEKTRKRLKRLGYANYAVAVAYASDEVGDYEHAMDYIEFAIETETSRDQLLTCYYGKADILRKMKKYEKAVDLCTEIIEKECRFYPAIVLRQECFLDMGYGADVISDYYRAVSLYPEGERPYEIAAKVFIEVGEYEQAAEVLKKAEENRVDTAELSLLKLQMQRRNAVSADDYKKIIEAAITLLEDKTAVFKNNKERSAGYYLASVCCCDMYMIYDAEMLDEALQYIEKAIILNPSDDECLNIKAYIYSKTGKSKEAISIYRKLLEKYPENCYYLFRLAGVYGDLRKLKKALYYYQKVAELDDSYPDVQREIGVILREMAEEDHRKQYYRLAVNAFNKQISRVETQYDLIERGRLYMELGMFEEAKKDIRRTMKLNPDNIYAYNAMGDIFRYKRMYEEAIRWYQEGLQHVKDDNTPALYEGIAQCYECIGRYQQAKVWYEEAMALFPGRGRIYDKYAGFYEHIRAYERAKEIFEKGQTLSSSYKRYFGMEIARMMEKYAPKEAYKIYRQAYKENSQDIKACFGIGRYYLYHKDKPKKGMAFFLAGVHIARENKDNRFLREGYFYVGLGFFFLGKRGDAADYFSKALKLYEETCGGIYDAKEPAGIDAHDFYVIGRLLALSGDLGRASFYFESMKAEGSCCEYCTSCTCFEYLMGMALLAYLSGNTAEAVRQYRQAGEIAGNDFECMTALRLLGAAR